MDSFALVYPDFDVCHDEEFQEVVMTKVLVVSSDHHTKKTIDQTLTFNGFTVHTATHSYEAWKFLEEIHFDLVMIDMQLDHESGLALYKSLRDFGHEMPLMMIGEGKLDEFLLTDLSSDHYDFILKPLVFRELRDKVNNFFDHGTGYSKSELFQGQSTRF